MTKKTVGRPTRLTPSVIDKLCEAIEVGANYADAAAHAGIAPPTLGLWRRSAEELLKRIEAGETLDLTDYQQRLLHFYQRFTEAESIGAVNCATVVYNAAMKDPEMALRWLERRRPEEWAVRQRHEITGAEGGPLLIEYVNDWRLNAGSNADDDADSADGQ